MFKKPEDVRMSKLESEEYGRQVDANNVQFENVAHNIDHDYEENEKQGLQSSSVLNEAEIKKRVGEQNYKNAKDDDTMGSINS